MICTVGLVILKFGMKPLLLLQLNYCRQGSVKSGANIYPETNKTFLHPSREKLYWNKAYLDQFLMRYLTVPPDPPARLF